MAKKKKAGRKKATVSKSQAVRDYLESKPDALPVAVSEALKKKGIDAAPSLVSQVKYQMKTEAPKAATVPAPRKKKPVTKAKTAKTAKAARELTPPKLDELTASELLNVKEIVDQLGGRQRVQEALQILRELS